MKKFLIFLFLFALSGCGKPKTVFICGDHLCVNKSEAEKYFEENLTLEVKIINKKKKRADDLIQLNLNLNSQGKKEITLLNKNNTNKKLKTLSNDEIKKVKSNIKKIKNDKNKKIKKKIKNVKDKNKKVKEKNNNLAKLKTKQPSKKSKKNVIIKQKSVNKTSGEVVDICTILEKCSIDEISKYLIKKGKEKDFPDISVKE
jgi:hypothetical protein